MIVVRPTNTTARATVPALIAIAPGTHDRASGRLREKPRQGVTTLRRTSHRGSARSKPRTALRKPPRVRPNGVGERNLYGYVLNDPINGIDPEGTFSREGLCNFFGLGAAAGLGFRALTTQATCLGLAPEVCLAAAIPLALATPFICDELPQTPFSPEDVESRACTIESVGR